MNVGSSHGSDPFNHRAKWNLLFAIFPHRCYQSGKIIWLKKAYQGNHSWTGPGEPVVELRWITKESFTFGQLRGEFQ